MYTEQQKIRQLVEVFSCLEAFKVICCVPPANTSQSKLILYCFISSSSYMKVYSEKTDLLTAKYVYNMNEEYQIMCASSK